MSDLTIGEDTFRVEIDGDPTKPPLMLSHALGTDLSMWDGQLAALARHFRIIRYDTRGHGGSSAGQTPASIGQLGRDVLAILDALEIERTHWLGLSMGGAVGLWLLTHAPDRIGRAVLANTAAKLGDTDTWNTRIRSVLSGGMEENAATTIERWFSADFAKREPQRVEAIHDLLRRSSPDGYAACCAALRDMDLREALQSIEADVLVIAGHDDPVVSSSGKLMLIRGIAGAQHIELRARHLSNIEAEADFTAAVIAFLTAESAVRRRARRAGSAKATPVKRSGSARRSNAARAPLKARPAKRSPAKKAAAKTTPKKKTAAAHRRPTAKAGAIRRSPAKAAVKKRPAKATRKKAIARRATPVAAARRPIKAVARKTKPGKGIIKAAKKAARKAVAKAVTKKLPMGRRKAVKKPRRPTGRRKP